MKYTQRNPANSIVLCEVWSGLRDLYLMQYGVDTKIESPLRKEIT